jgi:Berberine and berberine like
VPKFSNSKEASWEEPDWKQTMFGSNYEQLLKVKRRYDPNNVLWCYPCVGSEAFWMAEDGKLYRHD